MSYLRALRIRYVTAKIDSFGSNLPALVTIIDIAGSCFEVFNTGGPVGINSNISETINPIESKFEDPRQTPICTSWVVYSKFEITQYG